MNNAALDRALADGLRPRTTRKSRGLVVTIPAAVPGGRSTYRSLIDKHGNITESGTHFFNKLGEDPPNRSFDPSQEAERAPRGRSETILLRDGSRGTVRNWNHLTREWRNTQLGVAFFSQRSDRWLINIPIWVHH